MEYKDYRPLMVKPETEEAAMEMLHKKITSERMLRVLKDLIVFEEDANGLMDYLKQNPQASETDILNALLQITLDYAQSIGMSINMREWYSTKE